MPGERYRFGPFCLDVSERELRRDGDLIALTAKTFDLLLLLVRGAGRTFPKSELLEALWPGSVVEESNLSQTVFLLRKALGENGEGSDYILTVPRRGYKFMATVSPQLGGAKGAAASHAAPVPQTSRFWPAIAGVALLALAALAFVHFRQVRPEAPVVRSTILPPEKTSFAFTTNFGVMALSPDGRRMVFAATGEDGKSRLWIRQLDSLASRPLRETEGGRFPFWAPDSRRLGFFADGKLKKIDTQGGPPIDLADAADGRGGSWSTRGVIVFAPTGASALQKIPAAGGNPVRATDLGGVVAHQFPWFLPDGEHFLFDALKGSRGHLLVGSLSSAASTFVGEADSNAEYADGRLLFLTGTTLMAQPFDTKLLRVSGEALPVAEQIEQVGAGNMGIFSASATGLLAYQTGGGLGSLQLTWFDRAGNRMGTVGEPRRFHDIALSPDQNRLAATVEDANRRYGLWTYDLVRGSPARFTFGPAANQFAVWSADGRSIAFNSTRKGHWDIYWKSSDGSGAEESMYANDQEKHITSWSHDGRVQLYFTIGDPQGSHLWVLPLTPKQPGESLKPIPFAGTNFASSFGRFSSDDHWVAYTSNESQRPEIYVVPFSRPTEKHQISLNGGTRPRWRQDGKEIFYLTLGGELVAAELRILGDRLEVSSVRALFGGLPTLSGYPYDISADGLRILAAVPADRQKGPQPITLVENWATALRK